MAANLREDNARRSLRAHFGDLPFNPPNDQKFGSETYTVQHLYTPESPWVHLKSELYQSKSYLRQTTDISSSYADSINYGGEVSNRMTVSEAVQITAGADFHVEKSQGVRSTGSAFEEGRILGVFTQAQYQPFKKWIFSAGLRFDNYDFEDALSNQYSMHHYSPNVRVQYLWNDIYSSYASWSQAYRGATPTEAFLMGNVQSITTASDLKGTVAETAEVGIRLQSQRWDARVAYYQTVLQDLIESNVSRTTGAMTRSNAEEDLKTQGVQLSINYNHEVFTVRGGYSHNKAEYGDEPLGYSSFYKGSSSGDRFLVGVDYRLLDANMLISWDSLVVLKMTDVPSTSVEQPGYDIHDIGISWTPHERWRVGFNILNIFDKEYVAQGTPYQVQNGINPIYEPGRDFRLTTSYVF
ncbi:MAG: TonB-dependent receptor [Bdellovibrio sp.]